MNIELPFKVEIRAQGSSGFTPETIERRLIDLSTRLAAGNESAAKEIEYLRELKKRKGWE